MTAILILFAVGIAFLTLEIFLPGAVMGIMGGLAMLVGVVVAFVHFGAGGGTMALASAIALVLLMLYLEFYVLPKTRFAKSFTMSTTLEEKSQPELADLQAVINQVAETDTALAPTGYISLQGRRYEAFSNSGFLPRGTPVTVTGLDNFRLIVTKNKTS
jgi:membrane-bound ClpP family serine protease